MMSVQQQRQLIEASFVPYVCKCIISPQGVISIEVRDPKTETLLLSLDGILSSDLMDWGAISAFVEGLQRDVEKLKHSASQGIDAQPRATDDTP